MIASFGGAIVNKDGSRSYPASGGYVGGLSFNGGNWAYFAGAGKSYETFTPSETSNSIPRVPDYPYPQDYPRDYPAPMPPPMEIPPTLPTGNLPTTTGTTTTTSAPPVVNCLWGDCTGNIPMQNSQTLAERLMTMLTPSARTNVNAPPTLFSFIPNQDGGTNMKNLAILAIVAVVAYFLYKKYA